MDKNTGRPAYVVPWPGCQAAKPGAWPGRPRWSGAAPPGISPVHEAAQGGYRRSREHGMVILRWYHVQVVILPLVVCSQEASIRSATGFQ
jgi:hypothetical protein